MPSLRVNPKKKEVFEQAAPSPSKKIKTDPRQPSRSASEIGSLHASPHARHSITIGPGTPMQKHSPLHHVPKQHKFTLDRPSLNQLPSINASPTFERTSVPLQSSVPSLTTDADTSDASTSSDPATHSRGRSARNRARQAISRENIRLQSLALPRQTGQSSTARLLPVESSFHASGSSRPEVTNSTPSVSSTLDQQQKYLMSVLEQASAVLQEMDSGEPVSHGGTTTSNLMPKKIRKSSFAVAANGLPKLHPQISTGVDTEMLSLLDGVLTELSTGLNHGHGLSSLSPTISQYQSFHRHRFLDCLERFRNEAAPHVNVFLHPAATTALKSIYRCLSHRVEGGHFSQTVMSFTPPDYQLVTPNTPQHRSRIVIHPPPETFSNSLSQLENEGLCGDPKSTLLPSNGPPLAKLAPKLPMLNRQNGATVPSVFVGKDKIPGRRPSAPAATLRRTKMPQSSRKTGPLPTSLSSARGAKRKHDALIEDMRGIQMSVDK